MTLKLFITGTDTEIGKTYVATGLLKALSKKKYSTIGIKPVASGSFYREGTLINADAEALRDAATIKLPLECINPYNFEPAIAPHIAAKQMNQTLSVKQLLQKTQFAFDQPADAYVVEGFGGWKAPLNHQETMADFVKQLQLKTVLVVGMRLGCINHALLTYQALKHDGVPVVGWIANCMGPAMTALSENLATLQIWLPVPFLGTIDHSADPALFIDLNKLF